MKKITKKISIVFVIVISAILLAKVGTVLAILLQPSNTIFREGTIYKSDNSLNLDTYGILYNIKFMVDDNYVPELGTTINETYNESGVSFIFPKYNNETTYWKVISYSENVNESMSGSGSGSGSSYSEVYVVFKKIDKVVPKVSLGCDKEVIKAGESTSCSIYLTSSYDVSSISFKINADNYSIINESASSGWSFTNKTDLDNNSYTIDNISSIENNGISKTSRLMTFTLKAADNAKTTNLKDNVKINSIAYSDMFVSEDKITDTYATLNTKYEEPKKVEKIVENPKTGIKNYQIGILIASAICIASVYMFKKKNFIRKV